MHFHKTALLLALAAALALATAPAAAQGDSVGLSAKPQVSPDGEQVVIDSVTIDEDGWVVVHPEASDEPYAPDGKQVLGKTYVEAGNHDNVSVNISSPLILNQSLYAMLHHDDPADQQFTFITNSGDDPPVTKTQPFVKRQFFGNVSTNHFYVIVGQEDNQLMRKVAQREDLSVKEDRKEQVRQELQKQNEQLEKNQSDGGSGSDGGTDGGTDGTGNESDGGEDQPGFAVAAALAALTVGAALRRR